MTRYSKHTAVRGTTPEVRQAARALRKQPTHAESLLWNALKQQQLAGLRFRRQHPVGRFVLDFYCPSLKLVIEVDGAVHDSQVEFDAARTDVLESAGYYVLRFRNEEVLNDLPSVLNRIAHEAETQ